MFMEEECRKTKASKWANKGHVQGGNPWTVTVMGRHLAVWATEAKVPPEICLWRPTFTSKSLPMEHNRQPKLQIL